MITGKTIIVNASFSVWTATKIDRAISRGVDAAQGAKTEVGKYRKDLMSGTRAVEDIRSFARAARDYHYSRTLPWNDNGARILPMSAFMEYNSRMHKFKDEFDQMVADFLVDYTQLIAQAAFVMGGVFKRSDYPEVAEVAEKFAMNLSYEPLPEVGDFRVDLQSEAAAELKEHYEDMYSTRLSQAMDDAWERLHKVVSHMSEKLDFEEKGQKRLFSSMLEGAHDLCAVLTHLNVNNDPDMEMARKALEDALQGQDIETLKVDPLVRSDLKVKVDAISDMMGL